jgi:hypothetical protein
LGSIVARIVARRDTLVAALGEVCEAAAALDEG